MKKSILFSLLISIHFLGASKPIKNLSVEFEYKMLSINGTNGSSVAWHPQKKLYYTLIAGNASFPFEAFDATGVNKYVSEVGLDARGLWYNTVTKSLEINGYSDFGWAKIILGKNDHSNERICNGQNQPSGNSVGTFYQKKKQVAFFNFENESIDLYDVKKFEKKSSISLKIKTDTKYNYNQTTVVCTNVKGYEFALLNHVKKFVVYFDKSGNEKDVCYLPENTTLHNLFRFSFANNRIFIYNATTRTWTAYKAF